MGLVNKLIYTGTGLFIAGLSVVGYAGYYESSNPTLLKDHRLSSRISSVRDYIDNPFSSEPERGNFIKRELDLQTQMSELRRGVDYQDANRYVSKFIIGGALTTLSGVAILGLGFSLKKK